jgi:3'(2'), 5'-bisphosphate nucleotidase
METAPQLDRIVAIARRAGEAILEIYESGFDVELKADDSPLTQADLASHRVICEALARAYPDVPLLSEESAQVPFEARRGWSEYWLIDPLDGTREFVKRNGEFTVNIALVRDHYPALGVVHVPVSGVTYYGCVGAGSCRHAGDAAPVPIRVRVPAAAPPVVVGSRSHANPDTARRLEPIGPHRMVSMGSSLKFCLVAEGRADLYPRFGPTSEWDTAAAQAVVEAAGGQVLTLDGRRLRYNARPGMLNPHFLVLGDRTAGWLQRLGAETA